MVKLDYVSMIFYSVNDGLTGLSITIMFYLVGRSERKNLSTSKNSIKKLANKYGHSNFRKSEVDEGGDLSELCCENIITNNNVTIIASDAEDEIKDPWEYQ